jgi:hypothetical protein
VAIVFYDKEVKTGEKAVDNLYWNFYNKDNEKNLKLEWYIMFGIKWSQIKVAQLEQDYYLKINELWKQR